MVMLLTAVLSKLDINPQCQYTCIPFDWTAGETDNKYTNDKIVIIISMFAIFLYKNQEYILNNL